MTRPLVLAVALLVAGTALALSAAGAATAAQADAPEQIDGCTVIDESGAYELTADVGHDAAETCIEIRADDVVLDGNGHAIEGPGPGASDEGDPYRGIYVNVSDGVEIRNVEVAGWSPGIRTEGSEVTVTNAVVRDGDVGIFLEETGPTTLSNVTVADNDGTGIDTHRTGDLQATDVTLDGNDVGLQTWDAHDLRLEDSRVVNNDGNGVNLHHHSSLTLADVTVADNGGDGVEAIAHEGFRVDLTMNGGTVSGNGGHGVAAIASAHAALDGVALENNDGLELHGSQLTDDPTRNVTATDLDVGPSATTDFAGERFDLEPVARDDLPALPDDESTAGDGLNVSGAVDGAVDLTLAVDADADSVDLRRHDGDGWETVASDLDASDGTVEATVDENGLYAPVATDDGGDDSDGTDDGDGSDDGDTGTDGDTVSDGDETDGDDQATPTPTDREKSKTTPTPTPSDDDGAKDTPADDDGSKDTATPTEADDGSAGGSSTDGSGTDEPTATDGPTSTAGSTATDDGTATQSATEASSNETSSAGDRQQADEETETDGAVGGDDEDDDVTAFGDGPGFGPVVAVLALLAGALLVARRG